MLLSFHRTIRLLLLVALSVGCATAVLAQKSGANADDLEIATIKPPPRDIKDVLRMLDAAKPDLAGIELAKQWAAKPAPASDSDPKILNEFYVKRSLANQKLGQIGDALKDLRLAALQYPNPQFSYRDLIDLAVFEMFSGNQQEAIKQLEKVKTKAEQDRLLGLVMTVNRLMVSNLGIIGNFEKAKEYLRDTEATMTRLRGSPRLSDFFISWESDLEATRASLFSQQGQWIESERSFRKALRLFNQGLEFAKSNPKTVDELAIEGRVQVDGRNLTRHWIQKIVVSNFQLSEVLLQQRKLADAEFHAREGLSLALNNFGRNSTDVGRGLAQLSKVVSEQGRFTEALVLAKSSMETQLASGIKDDSRVMALSRKFYATALVANSQFKEADQTFNEMRASVRNNPDLATTFPINDLDWVIAMQKVGKHAEAAEMTENMLKFLQSKFGKNTPRSAMVHAFNGVSLQRLGKVNEAQEAFRLAIPIMVDQSRNDAENDTTSYKHQQRTTYLFENYLSLLAQVAQNQPAQAQGAAAEAFRVADLAKGSGVQRALTASAARANIKDPQLAAMARKEQDLQRRTNTLSELLTGLLSAPPEKQLPGIQAKIRQDIDAFKLEREKLKREIAFKYPDYADMVDPKPATVERARSLLRADEVLVSWYFGDQESYVWAISKNDIPLFKSIPMGRAEMAGQVSHLRKALDPGVSTVDEIPPFDVKASFQLYQKILAPVHAGLQGKKVLLVVPHADLGQLPLSVLVTQDAPQPAASDVRFSNYKSIPWLTREIAIAQLPSVTALTTLRNAPPASVNRKNFIGFGDPFFSSEQAKSANRVQVSSSQLTTRGGVPLLLRSAPKTSGVSSAELALLPRLPDTQDEVREIAKVMSASDADVFLNQRATVKAVMEADLSDRKVVMFATHGLVPGELDGLSQPALALTSPDITGDKDDGLLTMDRVLSLKLNADWVVLSACNTASGEGSGSEAVSGLGRAFFYAGARALLVSNWPVDSVAARQLMTDLFRRQQTGNQKIDKSEALRQAMLQLVDQGGMSEQQTMRYSYAHPLFWAPFMVVGD